MDRNIALKLFARADAMYRAGRYAHALAALDELAAFFPDNQALLYALALCHEKLEQRAAALSLCDRLIKEFRDDRALILKVRLITTPGDPPDGVFGEGSGVEAPAAWPESYEMFATTDQGRAKTAASSPSVLWGYAGVVSVVTAFLILLPVGIVYFAQADTAVPGATPTLFPGRFLIIFGGAMWAAMTAVLFLVARMERCAYVGAPWKSLFVSGCCAVWCLVPVIGWPFAFFVLTRRLQFSPGRSAVILLLVVGISVSGLIVVAYALGLPDGHAVYLELKAGYG